MAVSEHESSSSSASARQNANRNSRSASSNNAGACYLAKTVLRGSVVLQAVRGHFGSPPPTTSSSARFWSYMYAMEVLFESDGIRVNLSACLYKDLPFKALLWLDGGFVATIVDMTDGMVLKFEEGLLCRRSSIQNIAPILDMAFVDYPEEKSDQMFAWPGMAPEGSLRIIRSGICGKIV